MPFPSSSFAQSGRFTDIRPIGRGAFGQVYAARDNLGRAVAVKEARPSSQTFEVALDRFEREAQIQAALHDPHIISVYSLETDPQTQERYLVCEYAPGGSLADFLESHSVLSEQNAVRVALDICAALETTSSHQIVHADIKPSNILLVTNAQGQITGAKLSDFGIAQDRTTRRATISLNTPAAGTPLYMAPEQSNPLNLLDVRTDMYALGVTLWEMLTKEDYKPLLARGVPDLRRYNPAASPLIAEVIRKATQTQPADRYGTPGEMADALRAVQRSAQPVYVRTNGPAVAGSVAASVGSTPPTQQVQPPRRSSCLTPILGALLVLALLLIAALLFAGDRGRGLVGLAAAATDTPVATVAPTRRPTIEEFDPTSTPMLATSTAEPGTPAAEPAPTTVAAAPTAAVTTTTLLQKVKARGRLVCGVNADLRGFGYYDNVRQNWSGFDIDFCHSIAAAIFGDAHAVEFVATSSEDRFEAIRSGKVDVLFRNTTWTAERDTKEQLDFGPTTFHDGQGFMVRKNSNITKIADLAGKKICVEGSTTTEQNLRDQFAALNIAFTPLVFTTVDETYGNYDSGACDAVTSDRSQLAVQRQTLKTPDDNVLLNDILSREPLGPAFIQNDSQWHDIVSWTVVATIYGEEQGVTKANVASVRDTTTNPNIKRLLGTEGTLGQDLGIPNDFGFKIIQQVGNYEDIYNRNLGPSTPFNLDRGPNKAWNRGDGGVLSSPPFN